MKSKKKLQRNDFEQKVLEAFQHVEMPTYWGLDHSTGLLADGLTVFDEYTESTLAFKNCRQIDITYEKLKIVSCNFLDMGSALIFTDPLVFQWMLPSLLIEAEKNEIVGKYLFWHLKNRYYHWDDSIKSIEDFYTAAQIMVIAKAIAIFGERFDRDEYPEGESEKTAKLISGLYLIAQDRA